MRAHLELVVSVGPEVGDGGLGESDVGPARLVHRRAGRAGVAAQVLRVALPAVDPGEEKEGMRKLRAGALGRQGRRDGR